MDNSSAHNSDAYDGRIRSVLPYYEEYHGQIIDLVNAAKPGPVSWLDTGCGTGTLAARVLESRDDVKFTLCDPSDGMLKIAEKKLEGKNVKFEKLSSGELQYDSEFDVVTAVQCHHYLQMQEREKAVRNCRRALKEGGIFIAFENIRMTTGKSEEISLKRWKDYLEKHGNTPGEIDNQIKRRGSEVLPITIREHMELLEKCAFSSVNILWASYLQAGLWAIK